MSIEILRPRITELGKIKIGGKGAVKRTPEGREWRLPEKFDHFVITTLYRTPAGDLVPDSAVMESLKQFADMQQKYGTILSNKTPDIREANLGEKGTYHRLMVGPPGSRDSASSVCTQLKAEGYSGCWVTAY